MKVLIDADMMVYSCGFASEGEPLPHTFRLLNNAVRKILDETSSSDYTMYIGGEANFREEVAVSRGYKATRSGKKPSSYDDARQFLIDNHGALVVGGMEADDAVSLLLYQDYVENDGDPEKCQLIVSSPDKDLKNTPGWHHNPKKGTLKFYTDEQSTRHFWWQMLCGDSVDNIKGLPYCAGPTRRRHKLSRASAKGCGAGSATSILAHTIGVEQAEEYVIEAYADWADAEGLTSDLLYEYFLEQGKLLWMVREVDEFDEPVMFEYSKEKFEKLVGEHDNGELDNIVLSP